MYVCLACKLDVDLVRMAMRNRLVGAVVVVGMSFGGGWVVRCNRCAATGRLVGQKNKGKRESK